MERTVPASAPVFFSKRIRFLLWLASVLFYYFSAPWLYDRFGGVQGAAALLPTLITGALYGPLPGLAMSIMALFANKWILQMEGEAVLEVMFRSIPGSVALLISGPTSGWIFQQWRKARENLWQTERKLAALVRQMPAALWMVDPTLTFISLGGGAMANIEVLPEQSTGMTLQQFFESYDPESPAITAHHAALAGRAASFEITIRDRIFDCRVDPFFDAAGNITGAVGAALDVTEQRQYERQLKHLAEHDPLTDLWNRRRLHTELQMHVAEAQRAGDEGAVVVLDLDGFKYVNDSQGHQVGDELLRSISGFLQDYGGAGVMLARIGGDEFALLLPRQSTADACAYAQGLVDALCRRPFMAGGRPVTIGASAGIATYPRHGTTADELLGNADLALYRAKENGGSRVHLFEPDEGQRLSFAAKVTWEARIRQALEQDRFVLHGQPIIELTTGRISHYELLLRMEGDNGLILPGQFIEIAERFGLIRAIDRWVVRSAIRIAGERPQLRFTANLSAKALTDSDLLRLIRQELQTHRVDPDRLVFEITETAAISDLRQAIQFTAAVQDLGCGFALDDFGAGFTSFNTLRTLPVTYLKIDGSFVRNLADDPVNQQLVASMSEMARAMGKKTVAEFVETEGALNYLRKCGVDYAQGYYIGKPAPLGEAERSRVNA